jgi:Domain of unknown function (DUF4410)
MRALRFLPILLLIIPFTGAAWAQQDESKRTAAQTQTQTTDAPQSDSPEKSKIVYVSDFELQALTDKAGKKSAAAAAPADSQKKEEQLEDAAEQASRLVDLMSATLVKELQKAGYTAIRKQPGDTRPAEGLEIRGIFAEPDEQNRLRRAVIGDESGNATMELFVGVENLARPEQPLYAVADPKGNEKQQGAVISVTAYAPVAKFELDKNATEKAINDTAATIVSDLNTLLNANIAALTQ